ncbi:MAG: hypothetical protein KBD19_01910 [Candidatus Moranbacteria bacterium]|nr:hypothetical protein [Candidatus Moranbacteria bacterium]
MKKIFQAAGVVAAFAFFLVPTSVDAAVGAACNNATSAGTCQMACPGAPLAAPLTVACGAGESCCPAAAAAAAGTIQFVNPLSFTTVQGVTGQFLTALQGIIVTLALVFLVLGGVLYVISGGDEGKIKTAKGAITAAMIGLAIGIAAPSFLKEIGTILGWGGAGQPAAVTNATALGAILRNILNFLLSMVGILAIIMLVIGGLMYFAAAGDEKRADTAKSIVKFSIIGIAVALASLVIVTQIAKFF